MNGSDYGFRKTKRMAKKKVGGWGNIRPEDGKQFSSEYQPPEKWTEQRALELGYELLDWMSEVDENGEDKMNMFVDEFFVIKKRMYSTLPNYLVGKFTSFSRLYDTAMKIQEVKLKKHGVRDRLNATMTKFVLKNNHGWKEEHETQTDTNQVKPIEIVIRKNED